jgi:hypothetical protein
VRTSDAQRWYAAHLVLYLRFREGEQAPHYVMENVVLFRASSRDELLAKAAQKAHDAYVDDDPTFTCDDRPARWEYQGVRKWVECEEDLREAPEGIEVTYLEYSVADAGALQRLMQGDDVAVEFDGAQKTNTIRPTTANPPTSLSS